MKKIIYIFLAILMLFSCKKSRNARKLEKYIANTTWEFYKAEDADGNDITAQVLADSVICTKFTFNKFDNDPSTFDADICGCHNTYYDKYKGVWVVLDRKKIDKKRTVPSTTSWQNMGVSIGNIGNENNKAYLFQIRFIIKIGSEILENRIYKIASNGMLLTDSLLEKRYYKKTQ